MTLGSSRMQRIMIDVELGIEPDDSPLRPYTAEDLDFREKVAVELEIMHKRGWTLHFTPELP